MGMTLQIIILLMRGILIAAVVIGIIVFLRKRLR